MNIPQYETRLVHVASGYARMVDGKIPDDMPIGTYSGSSNTYLVGFSPVDAKGYVDSFYLFNRFSHLKASKDERRSEGIFKFVRNDWDNSLDNEATIRDLYASFVDILPPSVRSDPILCIRYLITRICQGNHRDFILHGTWNENTKKEQFAVSAADAILNRKTQKRKGQCFTFSALTNSVLRMIGIQTRQVISTKVGHPDKRSALLTVIHGEEQKKRETGSFWNYHCWNEVFVNGEWYFVDSTPQERSVDSPCLGMYVCGPCPVSAIRNGEKPSTNSFDFDLVASCTQGFIAHAVRNKRNGLIIPYDIRPSCTGKTILAESPSGFIDITLSYRPTKPIEPSTASYNLLITRINGGTKSKRDTCGIELKGDVPYDIKIFLVWFSSRDDSSHCYEISRLTQTFRKPRGSTRCYVVSGVIERRGGSKYLVQRRSLLLAV